MVSLVITKNKRGINVKRNKTLGKNQRSLLFVTLAIWFVFSIGIFLFAAEMNEVTGPFGYPWTYWFTCQGSLGIFVILCFWFANRQEKIDEEFGFNEREDE